MIQIFCASKGSGKTKRLIELANRKLGVSKGNSVFIDTDTRLMMQLKSNIRLVSTSEFDVKDFDGFYGMVCGLISRDYDIENIYIDSFFNTNEYSLNESTELFEKLKELSSKYKINMFINVDCDDINDIPDVIKEYVA